MTLVNLLLPPSLWPSFKKVIHLEMVRQGNRLSVCALVTTLILLTPKAKQLYEVNLSHPFAYSPTSVELEQPVVMPKGWPTNLQAGVCEYLLCYLS